MVFPWFSHGFPSINPLIHWDGIGTASVQVGHVAVLERGRGARASLVTSPMGAAVRSPFSDWVFFVVSHEAMFFVPCVNVFFSFFFLII